METCQVKRGFFVIKPCNAPAVQQCEECERNICEVHTHEWNGHILCSECRAKHKSRKMTPESSYRQWAKNGRGFRSNSFAWYYEMREEMYEEEGFDAFIEIVSGEDTDIEGFEDSEYEEFEQEGQDDDFDDDDDDDDDDFDS